MLNKIGNWCYWAVMGLVGILGLIWGGYVVYIKNFSEEAMYEKTRGIYRQILVTSGQTQDALPLKIVTANQDNAYNDGEFIVINTGAIYNVDSWDEVAFTLAHEVAHGMLGHTTGKYKITTSDEVAVAEGNADKLGAFYMMRAGYDICKARVMFKRYYEANGDFIGLEHPANTYRYSALNINCGGDL